MTFMTFDQLDQQSGPQGLFTDYNKTPVVPDNTAGYDTPSAITQAQDIANRSTFAAAFRQDNTVASFLSRQDVGTDNTNDPSFDPVQYLKDNNLQGYESAFMGVMNARRADQVKAQIDMENQDRQTLDASGWLGTFAGIAAGTFDLPALIPGSVAARGATGVWSISRSALMGGVSALTSTAASEGFLHATQDTRTAEESAVNIGVAAVMGSLLGAGSAAILGKNERITAQRALENMADINSGAKPNTFVPQQVLDERSAAPGGAQVADDAFYVDPIDKARTRDELAVEGTAASAVTRATSWLNPVLRGTQRYAASARQLADTIYESTIYRAMHSAGETTGVSVEAAARTRVQGLQATAFSAADAAYRDMRTGGVKMSEDDFYNAVGDAMRNNDTSGVNPFVDRAAQAYRPLFDSFTQDALKLGMLGEDDLDVKTASSYYSRVYNKDKLLADEPNFLATIGQHYANQMQGEYTAEGAVLAAKQEQYRQRIDDISQTGAARGERIGEIKAAGDALDRQFSHLNDTIDNLSEARGRVATSTDPAAKAQAQDDVRAIMAQGGDELKDYLQQRAALRGRMRNLTERNPDAQAARFADLNQRIDDTQEAAKRSIMASGRRIRNALNKLATDPQGKAEELLQNAVDHGERINATLEAHDSRIAQLEQAAKASDQSPEMAKFWNEQNAQLQAAKDKRGALADKLVEAGARITQGEHGVYRADDLVKSLNDLLDTITSQAGERANRRGENLAAIRERAAKVSPDEIKARAEAQKGQFAKVLEDAEQRFEAKWGPRTALGIEKNERYDFEAAGRSAAKEVYDKLTGKVQQREDVPPFLTRITSGPMKERTFLVPDDMLAGRGWLKSDVREVAARYSRAMAGEIELTRRFGRADMRDQLAQMAQEYSDMRVAIDRAGSVDEVNGVLGRRKYGTRADLAKSKLDAQKVLAQDEASAVTDTKAGRDLVRGTYNAGVNNTNFASVTRSLMHFNYLRQMGGVLLANLSDFYRPAMVHGLGPYLRTLPDTMARAFGRGSEGIKLSIKEAKLAGLVTERVTHSLMSANGDVLDPFLTRSTQIERFLHKATGLASRWNGINLFTDAQQAISSALSQHRILEAATGGAGKDGSLVAGNGERLLRMLGVDARTQGDIAKLFAAHGQDVDGVKVANTEQWLAGANATGSPEEIARAENAVRVYRAALNTDVNSIVSRRGLGDAPLFANHPLGKLLTQFSGYTMGAHSRVMVRGLQEGHARLIGGLVTLTALGALTSYLSAWRTGQAGFDKYVKDTTANPALLIGEGLDRSGFFPLAFDFANRAERVSGAVGYDYRFNPIKSTIAALGGRQGVVGITSPRASDSAGAFGALLGPSAGLVDSALATSRVLADKATGKTPPAHDKNQALAAIPFQSYYGIRELLQVLSGNSNFVRH